MYQDVSNVSTIDMIDTSNVVDIIRANRILAWWTQATP